jgi:sarcosine oxidase subunit beta
MSDVHAETVIIGGGLAGVSVAWQLGRLGMDAALIEAGFVGQGASGSNAGTLHFQVRGDELLTPARLSLISASIDEWRSLIGVFGPKLGHKLHGGLMVAESSGDLEMLRRNLAIDARLGLTVKLVTGDELHSLVPEIGDAVRAAIYCAEEGSVNPLLATRALADGARRYGVRVFEGQAVKRIRRVGQEYLLETESSSFSCRRVVFAAGAWTRPTCDMLAYRLPVWGVRQVVAVTERWRPILPYVVQHIGRPLTLKQTLEGTFLVGGGWPAARANSVWIRHGQISVESLSGNLEVAAHILPELRGVRLTRAWPGTIAVTSDRLPILGKMSGEEEAYALVVPRGMAGYTVTPLLARWLASLIHGDAVPDYSGEFSPQRWL